MSQNPQFCTKVLAYIQADIFSDIKRIEKKILRLGGSSIFGLTLPSKHSQPVEAKETRGNIARVFSTYSPHIILNVNCDLNLAMPKVLKTP